MPTSPFSLDALREIIVARFPELNAGRFELLDGGWDSVAVDADDRYIFKFPRHANGEAALRREVRFLDLVRSAVTMPVPRLELFETPQLFSRHEKIAGDHFLAHHYDVLHEAPRQQLGEQLGRFYAQLHTLSPDMAKASGARPIYAWLTPDEILQKVAPVLPADLKTFTETTIRAWAALPPDPYGLTYGYFDGHGWNMAFDHATGTLNGLYDFADSGIGPLHQEFIYTNFISADLTDRVIDTYETESGRRIDRSRVDLLTSVHRLWEFAMEAQSQHEAEMLASLREWLRLRQRG